MLITEKFIPVTNYLVEELEAASICHNLLKIKCVSAIIFYTKQTLPHKARIQKTKFTTVFVKQHINYDTQIIRNSSTTETPSRY